MSSENTEKEDDNFVKGMLSIPVIVVFAIAYFVISFYLGADTRRAKRVAEEANYHRYLAAHHCVRTGFAGKHADAVYQCDNGIWLWTELMKFSNPKESA